MVRLSLDFQVLTSPSHPWATLSLPAFTALLAWLQHVRMSINIPLSLGLVLYLLCESSWSVQSSSQQKLYPTMALCCNQLSQLALACTGESRAFSLQVWAWWGIGFVLKERWRNNCFCMVVLWIVLLPRREMLLQLTFSAGYLEYEPTVLQDSFASHSSLICTSS